MLWLWTQNPTGTEACGYARNHGRSAASSLVHPIAAGGTGPYAALMNIPLKRFALCLLAVAFFSFLTAGCQTSKGFGKDVEKLGDKIQEKSG
jgi:predicted small secreted protein